MSAFQCYAGAYEFGGGDFAWRCYATARVYDVRRSEHAPFPGPPSGCKWVLPAPRNHAPDVACLVDEAVEDFSQILLQVEPRAEVSPQLERTIGSA